MNSVFQLFMLLTNNEGLTLLPSGNLFNCTAWTTSTPSQRSGLGGFQLSKAEEEICFYITYNKEMNSEEKEVCKPTYLLILTKLYSALATFDKVQLKPYCSTNAPKWTREKDCFQSRISLHFRAFVVRYGFSTFVKHA